MGAPHVESIMLERLMEIRRLADGSSAKTPGLPDDVIERFCTTDQQLIRAIDEASIAFAGLVVEVGLEYLLKMKLHLSLQFNPITSISIPKKPSIHMLPLLPAVLGLSPQKELYYTTMVPMVCWAGDMAQMRSSIRCHKIGSWPT